MPPTALAEFGLRAIGAWFRPRARECRMPIPQGPGFQPFRRFVSATRPKEGPVFAVGGRAIVTCHSGEVVMLTDEGGTSLRTGIADGMEVEVLAWRPRPGATRYNVMSTDRQLEGWVSAMSLKARPPRPLPKLPSTGKSPMSSPLPARGARGKGPRIHSAPGLADGATIKIITGA